jgi:hypothetical protein
MYKKDSTGMDLIRDERESHFVQGYDARNDAKYTAGELTDAADAHLAAAVGYPNLGRGVWPFAKDKFRLNTPISSLAKAGSLIAAEIDRRIAAGEKF